MFLRHVQENPRPVHIWPGRFSYLPQNGQRNRKIKVVTAELTEQAHFLVSKFFGRSELRAIGFLAEVPEEPREIAGLNRLSDGYT